MLRKDLLRVSRKGDRYRPEFVDESAQPLAARVLGTYQGHVGEPRTQLESALTDLERETTDYKLVRGFAALLERDATFEAVAPLPPKRVRKAVFRAGESVGVASEHDRTEAMEAAADELGTTPDALEASLFADRDGEKRLASFEPRWDLDDLLDQYNLSLAATALFDATEVTVRSSDPKSVITAVKRLGLMYEIRRSEETGPSDGASRREVVVTGPDSLFRRTRRYGTAFARLLRTVAAADEWELTAAITDRGRQRTMVLTEADVTVPGVDPIVEPAFDSGVESDFAARFRGLDLDWELVREPEPLAVSGSDGAAPKGGAAAAGAKVMIPDFAFDYRYAEYRVFFEVMGFWTPEYIEKKLTQLANVEDVEMVVAVDESLGVGEAIAERDHTVITYDGQVRVKDVVDVLREFEAKLEPVVADRLPTTLRPDAEAVSLEQLAADHGVPTDAFADVEFPEHERVGSLLVRPTVLETVGDRLESGMNYETAEAILAEHCLDDTSSVLARLGFRVEWGGLSGGVLRRRD